MFVPVNSRPQAKTEVCLFYRNDVAPISIRINSCNVKSKKVNNVLGVLFDTKLSWAPQVELSKFIQILTSNFYSILYYNSEVSCLPSSNQSLKHSICTVTIKCIFCLKPLMPKCNLKNGSI
jgi:hypothetical protein